jgi:CelD/BcsL family acetyltransferase involved in cellulose biosynthesis
MAAHRAEALATDPTDTPSSAGFATISGKSAEFSKDLRLERLESFSAAQQFVEALGPERHSLPYHEITWINAWQSTKGVVEGCEPVLIAGYNGDRPAFFLPLALEKQSGLTNLCFLGHNRANQATGSWQLDAISTVSPASLRGAISTLGRALGADLIYLANMPEHLNGGHNPLLFGALVNSPSPVFTGELSDDFEALFLSTHSKASRKKLLKKQKALEAAGGYAIHCAGTAEEIERGLEAFLEQRAVRASATGIPNVFTGDIERAFLETLLAAGAEGDNSGLKLWWLECSGSIRATYLCIRTNDTLVGYANSIAHDDMTVHSPGVVLLKEIIAQACADPTLKRLDLGLGDERYKRSWTAAVPLFDCNVPLTARGRLAAWLSGLKQTAKAKIRDSDRLWPLVRRLRRLRTRLRGS